MMSGEAAPMGVDPELSHKLRHDAQIIHRLIRDRVRDLEIGGPMQEVIQYALDGPGKRIRSILVLWTCELLAGRTTSNAQCAAVALELVHTYSLIHDDLPAMDDDDLRRGRATCHKAFDEATAILAGDALLTLAFELLATQIDDSDTGMALIRDLAQAAGPAGMIAGQAADIKAEDTRFCLKTPSSARERAIFSPGKDGEAGDVGSIVDTAGRSQTEKGPLEARSSFQKEPTGDVELLQYIHTHKTAQMFRCAARMGALCAGADAQQLALLSEYGLRIGLGFQIADDILDVSASSQQLGKTAGKDQAAGKMTYPALLGMDQARDLARTQTQDALAALEAFGPRAESLKQLALALLAREK